MNLLAKASEWLKNQCETHLASDILYQCKDDGALIFARAVKGSTAFKSTTEYGIEIIVHSVDFIIPCNQLSIKPQKGDLIEYGTMFYEVLAPNNEPVWRWSGNNHNSIRVHTKFIGSVKD